MLVSMEFILGAILNGRTARLANSGTGHMVGGYIAKQKSYHSHSCRQSSHSVRSTWQQAVATTFDSRSNHERPAVLL